MTRSNSFIKKQKAELKTKKRNEKIAKRSERTGSSSSDNLESMIAYVDKFGNITNEPPVDEPETKKEEEIETGETNLPA